MVSALSASGPVPKSEPNFYAPPGYFTSLAQELRVAAKNGSTVSIVQLGDSHIQAGYTTAPLRALLQASFGDAGRGWIVGTRSMAPTRPETTELVRLDLIGSASSLTYAEALVLWA